MIKILFLEGVFWVDVYSRWTTKMNSKPKENLPSGSKRDSYYILGSFSPSGAFRSRTKASIISLEHPTLEIYENAVAIF